MNVIINIVLIALAFIFGVAGGWLLRFTGGIKQQKHKNMFHKPMYMLYATGHGDEQQSEISKSLHRIRARAREEEAKGWDVDIIVYEATHAERVWAEGDYPNHYSHKNHIPYYKKWNH